MLRTFEVVPANVHQSRAAQILFDRLTTQDLCGATVFSTDAAYDAKRTYHRCVDLGLVSLIAYSPKRAKIKKFEQLKPSN